MSTPVHGASRHWLRLERLKTAGKKAGSAAQVKQEAGKEKPAEL